jgi:hypothetical protein
MRNKKTTTTETTTQKVTTTKITKWQRVYEDEYRISIWKFDSKISMINPYEVEIKFKKEITMDIPKLKVKRKKS